tara:strand:- start:100 stop:669 length:570 start_codon:yes stop_codon:yes gene_type:complete
MKADPARQVKKRKILVVVGLFLIFISPTLTRVDLFSFPYENLQLSFFGFIFFDGLEVATLSFFLGFSIISFQLLSIIFNNKSSYDEKMSELDKQNDDEILNVQVSDSKSFEDSNYDDSLLSKSLEEVEELIGQLDLVLKKTRHDVFNLMLDPNGINAPDDFQSAVESLELALSCSRSIQKQINKMKENT